MKKLLFLSLIAFCWSCIHDSSTEKHQNKRDNIINVQEKVKEIEIDDIAIGAVARLFLITDYLIIADHRSTDKLIHLFDKNKFNHVTSLAYHGQGPGEITNIGYIETDQANRMFYVSDHGKHAIFSYSLDSVLANPFYIPEVKIKMNNNLFPSRYRYLNDTLSLGLIIKPIGNANFDQFIAKWNMNTGEIKPMEYKHPGIEKKRITFAASEKYGIYVECYTNHDLMTICNLNGNLMCNVYGPNWNNQGTSRNHHYGKVVFCNDKLLASYSGGNQASDEYAPTKFFVFDINGNYIQTIETGYRICDYCYDKENNRIILNLDDEMQFAYIELNEIIK